MLSRKASGAGKPSGDSCSIMVSAGVHLAYLSIAGSETATGTAQVSPLMATGNQGDLHYSHLAVL